MIKPKGIANSQHLLPDSHFAGFPKLHGLQCFLHHPLNFHNTNTQTCTTQTHRHANITRKRRHEAHRKKITVQNKLDRCLTPMLPVDSICMLCLLHIEGIQDTGYEKRDTRYGMQTLVFFSFAPFYSLFFLLSKSQCTMKISKQLRSMHSCFVSLLRDKG